MAILVSSFFAAICILINKIIPENAFHVLMSLVVSSLVINWIMISITHLKYRKQKNLENTKTLFPSFLYPISNYICLIFLFGILVIMWFTGLKISVELIPVWLIFLYIAYRIVKENKKKNSL